LLVPCASMGRLGQGSWSVGNRMELVERSRTLSPASSVLSEYRERLISDGPQAHAILYNWHSSQRRVEAMLIVGSISGILGFIFAAILEMQWSHSQDILTEEVSSSALNFLGDPFPSGYDYRPSTVSEIMMVGDNQKDLPQGKTFSAFETIGGICLLASRYPSQLRNVYDAESPKFCIYRGATWQLLREAVPPVCMLLFAWIKVLPVADSFGDWLLLCLHTISVIGMVGVYGICEVICLWRTRKSMASVWKPRERRVRAVLVGVSLLFVIASQVCGLLSPSPADSLDTGSCADVWRVPSSKDLDIVMEKGNANLYMALQISEAIRVRRKLLLNTAHGTCYLLKLGCFWFEIIGGVFMMASQIAIWWFCPERKMVLKEQVPDLAKKELRRQGYRAEVVIQSGRADDDDDDEDTFEDEITSTSSDSPTVQPTTMSRGSLAHL